MHYLDLTLVEIHDALVKGLVTPLELTQEALKRLEENKDNCVEAVNKEKALEKASQLTTPTDSLFWGIPYVAKDNFSTKGIETTASSDILKGVLFCIATFK